MVPNAAEQLCFFPVENNNNNNIDPMGVSVLRQKIEKVAKDSPQATSTMPVSWLALLSTLRDSHRNVVTVAEFAANASSFGIDALDMDHVLAGLHDHGMLMHFRSEQLRDIVILRPQWLIDNFARALNAGRMNHQEGLVSDNDIGFFQKRLWQGDDQKACLRVLRGLGLIASVVGSEEEEKEKFLIPSLFPDQHDDDDQSNANQGSLSTFLVAFHSQPMPDIVTEAELRNIAFIPRGMCGLLMAKLLERGKLASIISVTKPRACISFGDGEVVTIAEAADLGTLSLPVPTESASIWIQKTHAALKCIVGDLFPDSLLFTCLIPCNDGDMSKHFIRFDHVLLQAENCTPVVIDEQHALDVKTSFSPFLPPSGLAPAYHVMFAYRHHSDYGLTHKLADQVALETLTNGNHLSIFLDKYLQTGRKFSDDCALAIQRTQVAAPVLSWEGIKQMAYLSGGGDKIDYLLLECHLMLELHAVGQLRSICPVVSLTDSCLEVSLLVDLVNRYLPDTPSSNTFVEVERVWKNTLQMKTSLHMWSVRGVLSQILAFSGIAVPRPRLAQDGSAVIKKSVLHICQTIENIQAQVETPWMVSVFTESF